MDLLTVTLKPAPCTTRILATLLGDDCLRAELPASPVDPRAPLELLEALASWVGTRAHVAIAADARHGRCDVSPFDGGLLPVDTALVHYTWVPDRRPHRLRGLGDFRDLYRVHGRGL
jgi:hypothetical protein